MPLIAVLGLGVIGAVPAPAAHAGSGATTGRYIVRFASRPALDREIRVESVGPSTVWSHAINGFVATLSSEQVARLRDDPDVASVELDSLVSISTDQGNPPWGLDRIDQTNLPLDHSYSYGSTGAGVTAYVVDTGIRTTHSEFAGRLVPGVSEVPDGRGIEDCHGHGTHVAGTIGGATYGVAKAVTISPVRVLSCAGDAPISQVISGLDWIIGDHQAGVPAVANLSLGGEGSESLDAAVQALIDDGVTVVVAAGNDGYNTCSYSPARLPAAITVGASESDDDIANYSNYGPCNDLFAPGTAISSAWITDDTARQTLSGTSMATPHVAGAVARLLEASPWMSPAEVWAQLDAGATVGVLDDTFGGDPNKLLHVAPLAAPGAPRSVAGLRGNGQVSLTWLPPSTDNGSAITDYVIQYRTATGSWQTAVDGTSTATAATVTGLTNGRCYHFQIGAVNGLGTGSMSPIVTVTPAAQNFTTVDPIRLFDTRADQPSGAVPVAKAPIGGANELAVKVTGVAGVPLIGVGAVSLNVTAVGPVSPGFVTVHPCGARPLASNLDYVTGEIVANAVIAPVSSDGTVCFFSSVAADLVTDINGWFPTESGFNALTPQRLLDTRADQPQGAVTVDQHRYGDGELRVKVTGVAGIPDTGVGAVALNVTAVDPAGPGFITVYPCGGRPLASNLNYTAGRIVANAVMTPVSPAGEVCIYSSTATDVVADLNGWSSLGSSFTPMTPVRLFDTRPNETAGVLAVATQQYGDLRLKVTGAGGVPQAGVAAVSLNVTVVDPVGTGFVTVYPCGGRPLTSSVNYTTDQIVPNAVITPVSASGEVCFYSSVAADLIADVNGWYATS